MLVFYSIVLCFLCGAITPMLAQSSYQEKKIRALQEQSPFEKIIHGTIRQTIVAENESLIAFESISPQAPVHLLIVPKQRIHTMNEIDTNHVRLLGEMVVTAIKLAKQRGIDSTGYRLVWNTNEDAGQSVFHIHLHLLGGTKLGAMVDQTYRQQQRK